MTGRKILWVVLAVAAMAMVGQAAPLCTGNSIATIIANGPCQDSSGLFLLTFTATTGGNRTTSDSDIIVTATGSASSLNVVLAPDAAVNDALSLTAPTATAITANYNFHYTLSFAPTLAMSSEAINIFNANVIPAGANNGSVNGFKLLDSTFEADTTSTDGTGGFTTLSSGTLLLPLLTTPVAILDNVSLHANNQGTTATVGSGSANPGSVQNLFAFAAVPEPYTFALCGLGLLGVGLLRRRSAK